MSLADNLLAEKTSLTELLEAEYPTQNLRDSLLGRLYTIRFLLGELGSAGGDVGTLVLAVFKATDAGTGYLANDIIVLQQTPPAAPIYVNARTGSTITPDTADLGSVSSASNVTVATALPTGTNSIGQVTANAGTNLNTSALALEAGNLADIEGKIPSGLTVTANRILVDGSGVTQPVSITGTPTVDVSNTAFIANAGTDLNTSALALETGGNLAGINAKLITPTERTPNLISTNTSGTISAGAKSFSIAISGASAGTIDGVSVPAGVALSWQAPDNDTLAALSYDATGTTFLIAEVR